ncbi:MBL fold metallo-hydrolase [Aliidiomarina minuta]|uniref:MBL fold metallo-hydrolase n=1 Tax=Aliidiomarina minuta TaxID=880057 RepID=A0A432W867_9GAMM|nr:MBL fold metallo-hydrolase [Aliidiomarina minuta]RUO26313.1 MBL fold metallo-hydrolase [Aliidiomarina minuta]
MRLILCILLIALSVACSGSDNNTQPPGPERPDHHTDDGFINPHSGPYEGDIFAFIRMRLFGGHEWADQAAQLEALTEDELPITTLNPETLFTPGERPRVTWIGHATMLVQYQGKNVLTDPMFSTRASPVPLLGPRRHFPPAIEIEQLPPIDAVVISHNHYEHLDLASIEKLGNEPRYYVPLGLKSWFIDKGIDAAQVTEMDWWDEHNEEDMQITATPNQHWSARTFFDRNQSLWAAWHIRIDDFTFWFAGDTGYNDYQFRQIGERLGPVNVALIPIGAYEPRDFMEVSHANPEEAVKMHLDVQAQQSFAIHWATFQLSAEGLLQPKEDLGKARVKHDVPENEFRALKIGQSVIID